MLTKRSITINNSFVHGICNYNCLTCHVNKPTYRGPRSIQRLEVVETLAERVREADKQRLCVRAIGNSGDGEPLLHPEFSRCMAVFGNLIRNWRSERHPPPEVCIVTNGTKLSDPETLRTLVENRISLKISFPTADPEHYLRIMQPLHGKAGEGVFDSLIPTLGRVMKLTRDGSLPGLEFHISPPYYPYLHPDFPGTVEFLTALASRQGLTSLSLRMFPVMANRGGKLRGPSQTVELYRDYFRRYHRRSTNGVRVKMLYSYAFFYPSVGHLYDLWRAFDYPCLWFGNVSLSPDGASGCPNDQSVEDPEASILTHSLREIMEIKEARVPGPVCRACNQRPGLLAERGLLPWFNRAAQQKWLSRGAVSQRQGHAVYAARRATPLAPTPSAEGASVEIQVTSLPRRLRAAGIPAELDMPSANDEQERPTEQEPGVDLTRT